MFYQLTIHHREKGNREEMHFAHYESAYAAASRRANELLKYMPDLHMVEDKEARNFDKGTYSRSIILAYNNENPAVKLLIEGMYFEDGLVENFPDCYQESDFPKRKARYEQLQAEAAASIRKAVQKMGEDGELYASDVEDKEIVVVKDERDPDNTMTLFKLVNNPFETVFIVRSSYNEAKLTAAEIEAGILCDIADWLEENQKQGSDKTKEKLS